MLCKFLCKFGLRVNLVLCKFGSRLNLVLCKFGSQVNLVMCKFGSRVKRENVNLGWRHILTCLKYPKIKWSLPHLENESVDVNFCDI